MSISTEPYSSPEENQVEDEVFQPPAHHPSAPPHESFDILTTIDPSYVIALIRKLLPSDAKDCKNSIERGSPPSEPKNICTEKNGIDLCSNGEVETTETLGNFDKLDGPKAMVQVELAGEETWEECGCVLWDLAASEEHAQLMVQNLILEVLSASLLISQSPRISEISLGIIGNLACHAILQKQISTLDRLVKVVANQLFLDDAPCLCEACRVITLCLQGSECVIWAEVLKTEERLSRILWISENALNPQLIEKGIGVLLAILESQNEVAAILLPHIMKLDLSSLLINLLAFEMNKFDDERKPERYGVIDIILRAIEALSVIDGYSRELCLNHKLLQILKELIQLPDKFEIANSSVTAAVVIANIVTDAPAVASELSLDLDFLQGLFEVFPVASEDKEAQNAIWSTISRSLTLIQENEVSSSFLNRLVSVLVRKLDLIEEEISVHYLDIKEHETTSTSITNTDARVTAMKRISDVLTMWKVLNNETNDSASMENSIIGRDVEKLLKICSKTLRIPNQLPSFVNVS